MSAFAAYIVGTVVLAAGLGAAAYLAGISPAWIGVIALVVLGFGVMGAAKTKKRGTSSSGA